ncbi:MAG TPA: signal peptidase I, partial [Gaiellaceae bacterium]
MSAVEAIRTQGAEPKPAAGKSAWRRLSSILGMLVAVLVVMVAAVVVVVAVATRLSNKEQYTAFGHPMLSVLSGSMAPVVNTGDLIIDRSVTPTQAASLHAGQIITFYDSPGSKTVINHRIVKVVHQGGKVFYETKGDANNAPDAALRPSSDL